MSTATEVMTKATGVERPPQTVGHRVLPGPTQIYQVTLPLPSPKPHCPSQFVVEKTGLEAIEEVLHLALSGLPPYSQAEQTPRKQHSKTEGGKEGPRDQGYYS